VCQAGSSPSTVPPQLAAGWVESARRDQSFETWALLMDEGHKTSRKSKKRVVS
jgi:hypothetical protein